jgi:peptidyl-prolyl cis-trans isomerase C
VYLNKTMMPDAKPGAQPAGVQPAAAHAPAAASSRSSAPAPADSAGGADKAALDRGVAGLK